MKVKIKPTEAMKAASAAEVMAGLRALGALIGEVKSQRWYVVRVKGRHEVFAAQNLRANKHRVYLPMMRRSVKVGFVRRKGETKRIDVERIESRPFFPGYLFVLVRDESEWASITTTMGVESVVGVRGRFQPVRAGEVQTLMMAEQLGLMAVTSVEAVNDRLAKVEPGDPVKLLVLGEEMQAIFGASVDDERCMVLFSLCGRDSRTYVPKALVST